MLSAELMIRQCDIDALLWVLFPDNDCLHVLVESSVAGSPSSTKRCGGNI
eukprot:COSAG02_NODE_1046_length_14984_cov_12.231844_7_plen_50_part_00